MSATLNRRSVAEILAALKTALAAATWTPAGGAAQAAFGDVRLFDLANLEQAFQELLVSKQRVAFIIADSEQFNDLVAGGRKFLLGRTLPLALLLSDRIHGDRIAALYGNAETPGAEGLKEIALAAVTGQLLAPPAGVTCKPTSSTTLHAEDTKKKLPGRACIELDLECTGGTVEAVLNQAPAL